jgi:hypothetical protein
MPETSFTPGQQHFILFRQGDKMMKLRLLKLRNMEKFVKTVNDKLTFFLLNLSQQTDELY